jgi:hypothetical protein
LTVCTADLGHRRQRQVSGEQFEIFVDPLGWIHSPHCPIFTKSFLRSLNFMLAVLPVGMAGMAAITQTIPTPRMAFLCEAM